MVSLLVGKLRCIRPHTLGARRASAEAIPLGEEPGSAYEGVLEESCYSLSLICHWLLSLQTSSLLVLLLLISLSLSSLLPPLSPLSLIQDYIQRFGRGSSARQAQSKEKVLNKMVMGGLTEKVVHDKVVSFSFPYCGGLPPPVLMVQRVSFRYTPDKVSGCALD